MAQPISQGKIKETITVTRKKRKFPGNGISKMRTGTLMQSVVFNEVVTVDKNDLRNGYAHVNLASLHGHRHRNGNENGNDKVDGNG